MRNLSISELDLVQGGLIKPPSPPNTGTSEDNISPDITGGLSPDLAEQLIGYIEVVGAVADPLTAFESDVGLTMFDAVEQSILIPRMQDYCEEDLGEQWRPGPAGSLGYCEASDND